MANWFVAFPIDAGSWYAELPAPPSGLRRFAAEDLHLTLAFLGAVDACGARTAFEVAERGAIPCFELMLGRVVPMGSARRPSALSVLAERVDRVPGMLAETLAPVRDAILAAAGRPSETRSMRPHVTLGRLQRRARAADRRAVLDWARECNLGSPRVSVDRVALYTRAEDRGSRLFEIVESRALPAEREQR